MNPDLYPYGDCQRCHSSIAIPGLEAYLCSSCGWVARTKVRTPKVAKSIEPVTVISFTKPDAVKPEQTLLDFTL